MTAEPPPPDPRLVRYYDHAPGPRWWSRLDWWWRNLLAAPRERKIRRELLRDYLRAVERDP